jgi:small conductance mechanosensitive channel
VQNPLSGNATLRSVLEQISDFLRIEPGKIVNGAIEIALIWLGAWLAYRGVKLIARRIIAAVDDGDDRTMTAAEQRGHTIADLVRSVGRLVILSVGILLTLQVIFVNINTLLTGFGILSLAVSFGAQSMVKDFLAGFFILFENQFVVGDVIEAAGKSGTVERMTLRAVMLRDFKGVLHIIPNGHMDTVSNLTRTWSRAVIDVGVSYEADLDQALVVFRDEAGRFTADPKWAARFQGAPEVAGVEQLGEHAVIIRTLFRTVPGVQWEVAREFRRRIKNRLDAEGIEIPFPQRTVHVRHYEALPEPADVPGEGA